MLFSSIPFLYYFLPLTLAVYFLTPRRLKNAVLLLASLVFYGWGEPKFLLLLILSILCSYGLGLLIGRCRGAPAAKGFLALAVAVNLAFLGFFKYADFFLTSFSAVTGLSIPLLRIALPIGISFYTFQSLSYVIDVYRGVVPAQKNPITLAAYVAMFPQLIAGPIVRYQDVARQLEQRTHSLENAAIGIQRFVLGLGKKVLIANLLGQLCEAFRASGQPSVLFSWLYAIAFTLQIYFDFSGYSDMAIGLGRILGFTFRENFRYPLLSRSITEFWRRWHISLGTWFRDYLYIPLGGNRVSRPKWLRNVLVVWLLTGLWHGAAWNFVLWGLLFAILLMAEKFWPERAKLRPLAHLYVLFFVVLSFVLFNAPDLHQAGRDLLGLFGGGGLPAVTAESVYYLRSYLGVLVIAAVGATPLPALAVARLRTAAPAVMRVLQPVVLAALLVVITAFLVDGSFNPFLYFRF